MPLTVGILWALSPQSMGSPQPSTRILRVPERVVWGPMPARYTPQASAGNGISPVESISTLSTVLRIARMRGPTAWQPKGVSINRALAFGKAWLPSRCSSALGRGETICCCCCCWLLLKWLFDWMETVSVLAKDMAAATSLTASFGDSRGCWSVRSALLTRHSTVRATLARRVMVCLMNGVAFGGRRRRAVRSKALMWGWGMAPGVIWTVRDRQTISTNLSNATSISTVVEAALVCRPVMSTLTLVSPRPCTPSQPRETRTLSSLLRPCATGV
mmetsp:Transcript_44504/g.110784  ORF Transcript_44504/g.110784 Transcript_44504/m.110784 type:complete len:273 (-) Transcript_44504:525-1343(-)